MGYGLKIDWCGVKFPCKDCPDRSPTCDQTCEKYLEAKRIKLEGEKKRRLEREALYSENISKMKRENDFKYLGGTKER